MKYKIEPTTKITTIIDMENIKTKEDALIHFATYMDTDMSAYFKAIPISDEEFESLKEEGYEL